MLSVSELLLLSYCAAPRANYVLRTMPPSNIREYAKNRDQLLLECLAHVLRVPIDTLLLPGIKETVHLAARHGGLGLQSASFLAPAAYWASWADVLPTLRKRMPQFLPMFMSAINENGNDQEAFQD